MFTYKVDASGCLEGVDSCADTIAVLAQLGRFDLVSLLLAVLGLFLALGGVVAFLNYRSVARRHAQEEAERVAKEVAEKAANEYLQSELPSLIKEYRELIGYNLSDEEADKIAGAQEGDGR